MQHRKHCFLNEVYFENRTGFTSFIQNLGDHVSNGDFCRDETVPNGFGTVDDLLLDLSERAGERSGRIHS